MGSKPAFSAGKTWDMDTGFRELKRNWQWRGRRWFAGFVFGLSLGVLVGAMVAVHFDLGRTWTIAHFAVMLVAGLVVTQLTSAILGEPPRDEPAR